MPLNFIAKAAITVGLAALQTGLGMARKIEGPRLDDLSFTSGDYGASIMRQWGKRCSLPPIFWAEDLKEVKRRRKTKGGKYNEYTYYGTWAVAVACHEIDAVLRIWMDNKLVFDLTGAGPITPFDFGDDPYKSFNFIATLAGAPQGALEHSYLNNHLTIYLGTEDQECDPRIMAWTEAKWGEGSCSAHRGMAYIVFKDVPLEKFGNRIPQVKVESTSAVSTAYPTTTLEDSIPTPVRYFLSADQALLYVVDNDGNFSIIDLASRTRIEGGQLPDGVVCTAADATGRLWGFHLDTLQNQLLSVKGDGSGMDIWSTNPLVWPDGSPQATDDVFAFQLGDTPFLGMSPVNTRDNLLYYLAANPLFRDAISQDADGWSPKFWAQDIDGGIWAGGTLGGTDTMYLANMSGGPGHIVTMPTTLGGGAWTIPFRHYRDATHDHFIVNWPGYLVFVDRQTGAITNTVAYPDNAYDAFRSISAGAISWFQYDSQSTAREHSAIDGALLRVIDFNQWIVGTTINQGIYDPINHAWLGIFGDDLTWYYLDRKTNSGVPLSRIIEDVNAVAKGDPDDINAGAATDIVDGYSVSGGSGKDWLDGLLDLYGVDPRPHGFELEFVPRGAAPVATISSDDFVLPEGGGEHGDGGNTYSFPRSGGTDVPATMRLAFADLNADQEPNSAMSGPIAGTESASVGQLNMPTLALDGNKARQLLARYHRRKLMDRVPYSFALPASFAALEPADVETVALRTITETMRCTKAALGADGRIETEWRRDDPSIQVLDGATGAVYDGHKPAVILIPMIAKGFVLDIPLLRDRDESTVPLLQVAAGPYAEGLFPGAVIYEDVGAGYTEEFASVESSEKATWGYATDALGDAHPWLWDRGNSVNIRLKSGTLSGCTEADIDASPETNLCTMGGEIFNFTTAVLEVDGSWTLSGFKRGRDGTEWAVGGHAAGEAFLLLDTVKPVKMGLSEVGEDMSFKAIVNGKATAAFPIDVTPFTGASLKPLSPVQLRAEQDPDTGDWALSGIRRTRVGGAWVGGTGIPLSEVSEAYEVDILNDAGDVVRTIDGLTALSLTYSAAQQAEDFGLVVASFDWRAYQLSDAVGRGFAGEGRAEGGIEGIGTPKSDRWRWYFPSGSIGFTVPSVYGLELLGRIGGADQCIGGTPSASSEYDAGHIAAYGFASSPGPAPWGPATGNAASSLEYLLTEPMFGVGFKIGGNGITAVKRAVLQYWDGAAFQDVVDTGTLASWGAFEIKTFTV